MKTLVQLLEMSIIRKFDSFDDWSNAMKNVGATSTIRASDGHKVFAVIRIDKPVKHAFGHWDERKNEGVMYSFRHRLTPDMIEFRGA